MPVYWIVDGAHQAVEVWTPADTLPAIERAQVTWAPPEASEPLIIELAELFAPIE